MSGPFKTIARRRSPPIDNHTTPVNEIIIDRRAMAAEGRRSDDSGKTHVQSICSPPKGEANANHNFTFGPSNRAASSHWTKTVELATSAGQSEGGQRHESRIGRSSREIMSRIIGGLSRLWRGGVARRQPFEIYIKVVTECDLPDPPGPFWQPLCGA